MSENGKQLSQIDDTISTEEDIPGSSITFSIGDNSIHIKEKAKPNNEKEQESREKKEQWWLKKPMTQLDLGNQKKPELKKSETQNSSPDISSSMKDFLDKEKMCKKDEAEMRKDDTLQDILDSVEFDKHQSDLEDVTDEDIGSILDEMSKIARTMSPIERFKSKSSKELLTEEERSVEELLQEAEKLVQQKSENLFENVLKTEISDPDNNITTEGLKRVRQLEADIFEMIEQQVNDDTSFTKDKKSLATSTEIVIENVNTEKSLENTKFEEQKVKLSSHSDLNECINSNEVLADKKSTKQNDKNESLKKEITDVDKDFFDALIKKTKENAEQISSCSTSFDQEDFTHFLKLLQEQTDKEGDNLSKASSSNLVVDQFYPFKEKLVQSEKKILLEKDLVNDELKNKLYESETSVYQQVSSGRSKIEKLLEESFKKESSKLSSRNSSKRNSASAKNSASDVKKVVNNKNELYTVGLTPRLELFADAIPKLLAEKSSETNSRKGDEEKSGNEIERTSKSDDTEDFSFKNLKALNAFKSIEVLNDHKNVTDVKDFRDLIDFKENKILDSHELHYQYNNENYCRQKKFSDHLKSGGVVNASENKNLSNKTFIEKSNSYDQFTKPLSKFGSSLENVTSITAVDNRKQSSIISLKKPLAPKSKIQPKTVTKLNLKTKTPSKHRKEPMKSLQNDFLLDIKGNQVGSYINAARNFGSGDWKCITGEETLDMLYHEQRQKFLNMKTEMEVEIETYKSKLKDLEMLHEQEIFILKKQNILLKSKVDELTQTNKKSSDIRSKYDPEIMSMKKELKRQEDLINAYEAENKKLINESKRLKNELKLNNSKSTVIVGDNINNNQELLEKLKDLQEENLKLNIEISDLKQKNNDILVKYEDVTQQSCLLQDELEMIKDQLRAKNDFITDRLQTMTTNELELRKQVEDLKIELHSKTEQLKAIKMDYDKFQQTVSPLEKELLDLRTKCTYYHEKLQTAKNNCEREKQLTQKLKDQVILDNKNIMDLNRQVREMERILKRKNPDSVSALILTANSEYEKLNVEKVKLLEERIAFLENEIKNKEDMAEARLSEIQKRFNDMKSKYSTQVLDLENKLKNSPRDRKIYSESSTQTIHRILDSRNSEPNLVDKINSNKAGPKSQNAKEDTHLIATIRGLKLELGNKDKSILKLTKDFQELQKTNRKLQKERERLLNERRNIEKVNNRLMVSSDSKITGLKTTAELSDPNSNFYQNGHLLNGKKSSSMQKLYEPAYESGETNSKLKKLTSENEVLKEELSRLNKDFAILKNKRLQDLNLLQEEHEKEIALIVKEYSGKMGDSKALKLQGQVNSQIAMISQLKQQIEKLQDYKEQVIILKTERDHLEGKNRILNEKVKYLSTPSSQQLQLLQEKITILQQRHETRELSLQKLVRDLLRNRSQGCKDCRNVNDKGSKQQLCYFRQELDNILGTLQDLTSP